MTERDIQQWRRVIKDEWGQTEDGHDSYYDLEIDELCDLALVGLKQRNETSEGTSK